MEENINKAKEILGEKGYERILNFKTVTGIYVGRQKNEERTRDEVITVFVEKKLKEEEVPEGELIPKKLKGLRTDVVETGEIVPEVDLSKELRPVKVGCSIGNAASKATGTLGPIFRDEPFEDKFYGGSNSHVLFEDCSKDISDQASRNIVQPGLYHATSPGVIGQLVYGIRIQPNGVISSDSAGFEFNKNEDVDPTIPDIGIPRGVKELQEGEYGILKSWRYSGRGKLKFKNVNVKVRYPAGITTVTGVDIFERMSLPGTSGSTILTDDGKYHSHLNFAGSPNFTVAIPFHQAWDRFGKVVVTHDWWKKYKGGDEMAEPPKPPEKWSLRAGGLFLFAMGCYLINIAQGNMEELMIGMALVVLGLISIGISGYFGIQRG